MFGAIIGDIVGSRFEFNNLRTPHFDWFTDKCSFTDDTICTIAVMDALLHGDDDYGKYLHEWCRRYLHPMGGYGGRFAAWVHSSHPHPYGSYGNGSAMRVSPVAWFFDDYNTIKGHAEKTAAPTHGHPDGIRGAQAVASGIYSLRMIGGKSNFAHTIDGYYPDFLYQKFSQGYFDETCNGTVPLACQLLYASDGFEDAIRRTMAWGGDSDTLGAIVGSMAEAMYGSQYVTFYTLAAHYLTPELLNVVIAFDEMLAIRQHYPNMGGNKACEDYLDFERSQSPTPPTPYTQPTEAQKSGALAALVGMMAEAGIGKDTTIQHTIDSYKKAIDLGDAKARCPLADIYRTGKGGTPIDLAKALELYEGSNEGYAHYRCGEFYEKGWGTEISHHKAKAHYQEAYRQRFPLAIRKLKEWNYFLP